MSTIWDDPALAGARDTKPAESKSPVARVAAGKPRQPAKRGKKSGKRYGTSMRWIRRIHLYSGLFMLPFVLLYGVSAMYFNHPELISSSTTSEFNANALGDSPLPELPVAEALAAQILTAINDTSAQGAAVNADATDQVSPNSPKLLLNDPSTARFVGSISYSYLANDTQYSVSINPATREATVRASERRERNDDQPTVKNPFAEIPARPELASFSDKGRGAAVAALREAGVTDEKLWPESLIPSRRGSPRFQFDAEAEGTTYRVSYDLATGQGTASPLGEAAEIEPERFLMRLHVAHGYPDEMNIRWWWALVVDAMFVNMVMWGLSGVLMWWQLKKTRKLGTTFLVASALVTYFLFMGMHEELVANSRRSAPTPQVPTPSAGVSAGDQASTAGRRGQGRRGRERRERGQGGGDGGRNEVESGAAQRPTAQGPTAQERSTHSPDFRSKPNPAEQKPTDQ